MRTIWLATIAAAAGACGRVGFDARDAGGDGGDDGDAMACAQPTTFHADRDGDGFGDPAAPIVACSPPAGAVANADDCDDGDRHVHPGAPEVCDGLDNDCDPATIETCPTGCVVLRRPAPDDAHTYLLCGAQQPWDQARATCMQHGFDLVQIDDAAEDEWLRAVADSALGLANVWLGGSDLATEETWVWVTGVTFWQGAAGGAPVGGAYTNWGMAEPNNADPVDGEDCLAQDPSGTWNDMLCTAMREYACERP